MANLTPRQSNSRASTNGTLVASTTVDEDLNAALDLFKKTVPDKDFKDFQNVTHADLCKRIMQIQEDQNNRRDLIGLSRVKRCLEAMNHFGQVVEVFLNVHPIVCFVWGPMKLLIQTASTHNESFETLIVAYERIGEQMPLFKQYKSLSPTNSFLQDALKLIYVDILEFHRLALRFFNGHLWKRFFRAMWKDFDTQFSGILERLGRHKSYVEQCAHLAFFQQILNDQAELRKENQLLHQSHQDTMTTAQAAYLTGIQDIQADITRESTHALLQIQGVQADVRTNNTVMQAQWQRQDNEMAKQSAESLALHRNHLKEIKNLVSKLTELVLEERQKRMAAIRAWLAVGDQVYEDDVKFRQTRTEHPSTTKWIMELEAIKGWTESDSPATPNLWLNGIPGAGKTILASALIDECRKQSGSTCFFYCHGDDPMSCSAVGIIKALVEQLLIQHPNLLPPTHVRRTASGEPVLRSIAIAVKMFEELCLSLPRTYIVVDGLDECGIVERKQALEALLSTVSQCDAIEAGKARLLIVSQDYADISRVFNGQGGTKLAPKIIKISHDDNEKDIYVYVRTWVAKIASKYELTQVVTEYLVNLTVANAKGMFLFAKLVMQNLHEQPTREALLLAIRDTNFPTGLSEAYERILERIKTMSSRAEWTEATKLLGWMVCAKRRLTWKEMQVALSIDIEHQAIEYDNKHLRKHIHEICGSLISVQSGRVSFVHSTAKTFITRVVPDIHEPSIECDLTVLCLQYLTFPCFDKYEKDTEKDLQKMALQGYLAFQDYAIATWFHHVNAFVNSGQDFLDSSLDQSARIESIATALDDFMSKYSEVDWESGLVERCRASCSAFEPFSLFENLMLLASHIYTFQDKGFEARHKISIKSLDEAVTQNRKILEELPAQLEKHRTMGDLTTYSKFYDAEKLYKCNRITCRYFSEGFNDKRARKHHVNVHDRPFYCEIKDCLGAEGFAKDSDLQKHMRSFHPELCDLAQTFNTATAKRGKADHACSICGKTFTRSFHRKNHELSHKGERPHSCPECGKAFTRLNDCKRHQKIHERGLK